MVSIGLPQLSKLEALRGNPLVVYHAAMSDDAVPILYECLRRYGPYDRLDLVLSTTGGSVIATRRIALLLREYARHLTILVPYRAWSAGTLLCLCANELVLGPLAELGPIDALTSTAGEPPPGMPGMISSEDIRAFRQLAEHWFGVTREEDRLQVLALVAQRIFPTTLSGFYRSDQLIRQVAHELLAYQLREESASTRQRIVDRLVGGYHAHDYPISRADAREIGLRVTYATPEEAVLLWELRLACSELTPKYADQALTNAVGMIASSGFLAQLTTDWDETSSWGTHDGQGVPLPQARWVIDP